MHIGNNFSPEKMRKLFVIISLVSFSVATLIASGHFHYKKNDSIYHSFSQTDGTLNANLNCNLIHNFQNTKLFFAYCLKNISVQKTKNFLSFVSGRFSINISLLPFSRGPPVFPLYTT